MTSFQKVVLGIVGVFVCSIYTKGDDAARSSLPAELRYFGFTAVSVTNTGVGKWFVDFGQDAFGYVSVRVKDGIQGTNVAVRLGEMRKGFAVETKPQGLVR